MFVRSTLIYIYIGAFARSWSHSICVCLFLFHFYLPSSSHPYLNVKRFLIIKYTMEQPEKKSNSFFRKMVEASRVHKRTRIHIGFRISTCFVVRLSFEFFDGRFSNGEFILLSSIHTLACTQKWYVRWLDQLDTFFNKKMESRQDRWQNSLFFMCVCVSYV